MFAINLSPGQPVALDGQELTGAPVNKLSDSMTDFAKPKLGDINKMKVSPNFLGRYLVPSSSLYIVFVDTQVLLKSEAVENYPKVA